MKKNIIIMLLIAGFMGLSEASEPNTKTLCQETEAVIFSCPTKSGKHISVCSGAKVPVKYLFGNAVKVELVLPVNKDVKIGYNSIMYSGGGGGYVRFKTGPMEYIVYSRTGRGFDEAGVIVQKSGKKIATVTCKIPSEVDLSTLEKLKLEKEEFGVDPTI
jgi:hypothetical protein